MTVCVVIESLVAPVIWVIVLAELAVEPGIGGILAELVVLPAIVS